MLRKFRGLLVRYNNLVVTEDDTVVLYKIAVIFSSLLQIKATVFHYIRQKGVYDTVLTTPHFPELINYLVTEDSIEGLLLKCLLQRGKKLLFQFVCWFFSLFLFQDMVSTYYAVVVAKLNPIVL